MSNSEHIRTASLADALGAGSGGRHSGLGRRERRAAETRVRLFRSALQLIAKRGFPNVTVEEITEAADVGKGTFFNYFETKDHVLGVMAEIQLGKVREAASIAGEGKKAGKAKKRFIPCCIGWYCGLRRNPDAAPVWPAP
jgi:AcrR family transcriptional regulator